MKFVHQSCLEVVNTVESIDLGFASGVQSRCQICMCKIKQKELDNNEQMGLGPYHIQCKYQKIQRENSTTVNCSKSVENLNLDAYNNHLLNSCALCKKNRGLLLQCHEIGCYSTIHTKCAVKCNYHF
jgi:hypothetical protein